MGLFRTGKFIEDVEEEKDVTREIIPLLPVKLEIPDDEFVEKYKGIVYDGIKAGRTDVQSNGKKRVQGTSNVCKQQDILVIANDLCKILIFLCALHRIVR